MYQGLGKVLVLVKGGRETLFHQRLIILSSKPRWEVDFWPARFPCCDLIFVFHISPETEKNTVTNIKRGRKYISTKDQSSVPQSPLGRLTFGHGLIFFIILASFAREDGQCLRRGNKHCLVETDYCLLSSLFSRPMKPPHRLKNIPIRGTAANNA